MFTVYVIAGGDMWREAMNGTVAVLGSRSFESMIKIAGVFSVISVLMFWLKGRDVKAFLRWLAVFFVITIICLVPKRPVQIIDVSNQAAVYEIDNVPVVLGFVASLATTTGYATASLFDQDISLPDSLQYSKTGMSFGADLVVSERDAPNYSFPVSDNLVAYMNKCAVPAILINNQYHVHDILEAQDISQVIFQNPSQIANMPYTDANGNVTLVTCFAGAASIQKALNTPLTTFQQEISKWTHRIFGNNSTASTQMDDYIQDSSAFFYGVGKSQTDILKKRIMQTAVNRSIATLAAEDRNDSMAEIIAEQQTAMKTNMQGKVEQHIGARYMPLLHSVLELILVCIFPLVIVVALISHETFGLKTLLTYAGGWFYLQLWPVMFSLVNFISVYSLKAHTVGLGGGDSLSARYEIAGYYTDMSAVAGYLCLGAIPVLSYLITKGAAALGSQVVGAVTGGAALASGASASLAEDGNWSFNNLSQDNVNANKWNTNVDHREGMTTNQMGNGALTSTTADGSHVLDAGGAVSKLPVNLNWASTGTSGITQSARQHQTDANTSSHGFTHSNDTAFSTVNDMTHATSHGDAVSRGSESSDSISQSKTASHLTDMAHNYAQRWGVTDSEAFNRLVTAADNDRYHIDAGGHVSAGLEVAGTGGGVRVAGGVGHENNYSDQGNTSKGSARSSDHTHDVSAADRQDFRESMDSLRQSRNYSGGNATDSETNARAERLESAMRTSDSEYQQYVTSQTKANELSQMAQRAQTDSAGFNANMNQEFVEWARARGVTDEQLTTVNEASPLAAEFARERFGSNLNAGYAENVQQAMGTPVGKAFPEAGNHLGEHYGSAMPAADGPQIVSSQPGQRSDYPSEGSRAGQPAGGSVHQPQAQGVMPGESEPQRVSAQPGQRSDYPSEGSRPGQPAGGSVHQPQAQAQGESEPNRVSTLPGQRPAQQQAGSNGNTSAGDRQGQNFSDNNARLNAAAQGRGIPAAVEPPKPLNTEPTEAMEAQREAIEKQQRQLQNSGEIRQSGFGKQYENHKQDNERPMVKIPGANSQEVIESAKRYAGYKR